MSLPSPSLAVPSLADDSIQFQGVVLGNGSPYGIKGFPSGLEKPDARSGNTPRAQSRGAWAGVNLLSTRALTVNFEIGPIAGGYGTYGSLQGAVAALRAATSTEGAAEYPLWIKLPGFSQVACMARVLKKSIPYDYVADRGLIQNCSIQFEATDSYLYSSPTAATTIGLPTPGGGMTFPMTFPLSFGGGTTANSTVLTNSGDVPAWPVLVITGPCLNPTVSNMGIAGNPTLSFNQQLYVGDQLVVDCDSKSVLFYPSGQTTGAYRQSIVQAGSTFFSLVPGTNQLSFNSQDTSAAAGTLTIWNASAYSGLL